jgi:hypothetical protein
MKKHEVLLKPNKKMVPIKTKGANSSLYYAKGFIYDICSRKQEETKQGRKTIYCSSCLYRTRRTQRYGYQTRKLSNTLKARFLTMIQSIEKLEQ